MAKPRPHPPQERKSHSTARRRSCAPLPTAQAVRLSAHRRLHCVQFRGVRLISPAREGRAARSRLTAHQAAGAALAGRGRATCQGRATQASGTLLSCISAAPRPHLGRTSAASRPHLGRISAASRLSEPPLHARPLVFAWQRPRAADVVPARAPRRESSHSRLAATRLARHQPTIGFPRFFSGRLHATRAQRCHGVSCWQSGPQRRGLSPDPQLSRLDRLPTHAAAGAVCLRPLHAAHRRLVTARAVRRRSLAPSALSPPPPPLIRLPVRARAPARVLQRVVAVRVVVLLSPAHAAARPLAAVGGRLPDMRRTCHARVTDSSAANREMTPPPPARPPRRRAPRQTLPAGSQSRVNLEIS